MSIKLLGRRSNAKEDYCDSALDTPYQKMFGFSSNTGLVQYFLQIELYFKQVFFAVLIGAINLGQASPNLEAFSVGRSAAALVFQIIERVCNRAF